VPRQEGKKNYNRKTLYRRGFKGFHQSFRAQEVPLAGHKYPRADKTTQENLYMEMRSSDYDRKSVVTGFFYT